MYVKVRLRRGAADRGLMVRCRTELLQALAPSGQEVDWAVFLFDEDGVSPTESVHRCQLTLGRKRGSSLSVEARGSDVDDAMRRAVARSIVALAPERPEVAPPAVAPEAPGRAPVPTARERLRAAAARRRDTSHGPRPDARREEAEVANDSTRRADAPEAESRGEEHPAGDPPPFLG